MSNFFKKILVFCGVLTSFSSFAHLPSNISMAPMLAIATPAVVNIAVEKSLPNTDENALNSPPRKAFGVGSGVIFDAKKGLIVTNAHVVSDEQIMVVTLKDGRRYRAQLVGKDDGFDIAIIRIPSIHLTALPFGDSDQLKVGDFVAAIGSPFGFTQSVTSGVISALNRVEPKIEGFQSFIQTDAPINPGNSGGGLVNMQGQLIGINTAIFTPVYGSIGIGFSIPSNMVNSVITQLLKYGHVKRGMLGVVAQDITPELAQAFHIRQDQGALVTQVIAGSPAAKAGVHPQDVMLSVNQHPIHGAAQLRNLLGLLPPGTPLVLKLERNHTPLILTATVGDPNHVMAQNEIPFLAGLRLQDFNELEGSGEELRGVVVTDVSEMSQGALAGLIPGDIITSANKEPVGTVNALKKIALSKPSTLLLQVSRNNQTLFLVIESLPH